MGIEKIRYNWKLRSILNALVIILYLLAIIAIKKELFIIFIIFIIIALMIEILLRMLKGQIMQSIKRLAVMYDLKTDKLKKNRIKGRKGEEQFISLMESKGQREFIEILKEILN